MSFREKMRKVIIGFVAISLLLVAYDVSAESCDDNYGFVKVKPRKQPDSEPWCWAAAEQMVLEYFGGPHDQYLQCRLVTEDLRFRKQLSSRIGSCCDPENMESTGSPCSVEGLPEFALHGIHAKVFNANPKKKDKPNGLEWSEIKDQICHGRPIVFSQQYVRVRDREIGLTHMMVMNGYKVSPKTGTKMVWVIDPASAGAAWRDFEKFYVEFDRRLGNEEWKAEHSTGYIEICPLTSVKEGKCE
jgi:hypothetical protein